MQYISNGFQTASVNELGIKSNAVKVLDWYAQFMQSGQMACIKRNNKIYNFIDYAYVMDSVPAVKWSENFKSASQMLKRILDDLVKLNVLERVVLRTKAGNKVFIRFVDGILDKLTTKKTSYTKKTFKEKRQEMKKGETIFYESHPTKMSPAHPTKMSEGQITKMSPAIILSQTNNNPNKQSSKKNNDEKFVREKLESITLGGPITLLNKESAKKWTKRVKERLDKDSLGLDFIDDAWNQTKNEYLEGKVKNLHGYFWYLLTEKPINLTIGYSAAKDAKKSTINYEEWDL